MKQDNIPPRCQNCWNYTGNYCEVHLHLIEAAANCSEWSPKDGEYPESDLQISVAHLREILDKCVEVGYINEYSKHRIIELVKKEI